MRLLNIYPRFWQNVTITAKKITGPIKDPVFLNSLHFHKKTPPVSQKSRSATEGIRLTGRQRDARTVPQRAERIFVPRATPRPTDTLRTVLYSVLLCKIKLLLLYHAESENTRESAEKLRFFFT